jgi:hypothetical protein
MVSEESNPTGSSNVTNAGVGEAVATESLSDAGFNKKGHRRRKRISRSENG